MMISASSQSGSRVEEKDIRQLLQICRRECERINIDKTICRNPFSDDINSKIFKRIDNIEEKINEIINKIYPPNTLTAQSISRVQQLPTEIKNKIMFYTLKCPHNIKIINIPKWIGVTNCDESINKMYRIKTKSKRGYTEITEGDICTIKNHNGMFILYANSIVNDLHEMSVRRNQSPNGHFLVPCAEIKQLASFNKIKGRSKFKTRLDYVKAFMKF